MSYSFDLVSPCPLCPFRNDIRPYLRRDRVKMIAAELEHKTFSCHETTGVISKQPRDSRGRFMPHKLQHCAGAMILMHKCDRQGDMQQIAERLGLYSRRKLRMDAPVFDTFEEMIEAQTE